MAEKKRIAIIGGGPAGLFMYKKLVASDSPDIEVVIFEKNDTLGAGMPYSSEGASDEHITNVSDTEIPELVTTIKDWIRQSPPDLLKRFDMKPESFNEYKVVPRLLFGEYLSAQFKMLLQVGKKSGIVTDVKKGTTIIDITDLSDKRKVLVQTSSNEKMEFDAAVICIGHRWPKIHEGKIPNWFDSPYPPSKLMQKVNFRVAIKGSSLSAIDVLRTLARSNGRFIKNNDSTLSYRLDKGSEHFRLVMHSIDGLLPAVRFHVEDSKPAKDSLMTEDEVKEIKTENGGFVPLDYVFERHFKEPLRQQDPVFYDKIRHMQMEDFVDYVMGFREQMDAFQLFKAEYAEAEKSIRREKSVYWKEMLAELSYAMNYPAKHFSAEDMLRLKKTLMPLIAIVIAFVPQNSCRELLALYDAGVLSLVPVDRDSCAEPADDGGAIYRFTDEQGRQQQVKYELFIDAVGQKPFLYGEFPFEGLRKAGVVSPAHLRFQSEKAAVKELEAGNKLVEHDDKGNYYLKVPGIQINDHYQVMDRYGVSNPRVYIMAVPYIAGLNPDYSGLDFCDAASDRINMALQNSLNTEQRATA